MGTARVRKSDGDRAVPRASSAGTHPSAPARSCASPNSALQTQAGAPAAAPPVLVHGPGRRRPPPSPPARWPAPPASSEWRRRRPWLSQPRVHALGAEPPCSGLFFAQGTTCTSSSTPKRSRSSRRSSSWCLCLYGCSTRTAVVWANTAAALPKIGAIPIQHRSSGGWRRRRRPAYSTARCGGDGGGQERPRPSYTSPMDRNQPDSGRMQSPSSLRQASAPAARSHRLHPPPAQSPAPPPPPAARPRSSPPPQVECPTAVRREKLPVLALPLPSCQSSCLCLCRGDFPPRPSLLQAQGNGRGP